jgi:hypothetical protein
MQNIKFLKLNLLLNFPKVFYLPYIIMTTR